MLCSQFDTNLALIPWNVRLYRLNGFEFAVCEESGRFSSTATHISYLLLPLPTTINTLQLPPTGAVNYDHLPNY